ncbi:hypothetical protein [Mucilaginibacter lappiensis]|uniref:Uncharacterized protein n=1 Tax=Mucilaginibacter lappiensis TaxID=354630 RepID=A0A841J974_9SPHI|nr:hypothetical protein [Mucilaginibacter lappiensis]MBB6126902.1 hypothetical protein [Mucilaginibacter lappiensis]
MKKYEIEDGDNKRGDKREMIDWQFYDSQGVLKIKIPNYNKTITVNNGMPVLSVDHEFNPGNIFCMYCIDTQKYKETSEFRIDERVLSGFGSECLIILDPAALFERIETVLKNRNLTFQRDFVRYENLRTFHGSKSPFIKDTTYNYQNEYRIFIKNPRNNPLSLELGSLEDISIRMSNMNGLFKFEYS